MVTIQADLGRQYKNWLAESYEVSIYISVNPDYRLYKLKTPHNYTAKCIYIVMLLMANSIIRVYAESLFACMTSQFVIHLWELGWYSNLASHGYYPIIIGIHLPTHLSFPILIWFKNLHLDSLERFTTLTLSPSCGMKFRVVGPEHSFISNTSVRRILMDMK